MIVIKLALCIYISDIWRTLLWIDSQLTRQRDILSQNNQVECSEIVFAVANNSQKRTSFQCGFSTCSELVVIGVKALISWNMKAYYFQNKMGVIFFLWLKQDKYWMLCCMIITVCTGPVDGGVFTHLLQTLTACTSLSLGHTRSLSL